MRREWQMMGTFKVAREARRRAVGVSQRGKATERLGQVKRAAARIILTAPDDWGRDTVGCTAALAALAAMAALAALAALGVLTLPTESLIARALWAARGRSSSSLPIHTYSSHPHSILIIYPHSHAPSANILAIHPASPLDVSRALDRATVVCQCLP